jgi:hypothetical protein
MRFQLTQTHCEQVNDLGFHKIIGFTKQSSNFQATKLSVFDMLSFPSELFVIAVFDF